MYTELHNVAYRPPPRLAILFERVTWNKITLVRDVRDRPPPVELDRPKPDTVISCKSNDPNFNTRKVKEGVMEVVIRLPWPYISMFNNDDEKERDFKRRNVENGGR